jgi:hypothetical protein
MDIDPNPTGRRLAVYRQAAKRCGIPYEEWHRRQLAGEKRCFRCKEWHPRNQFSKDSSRTDGRSSSCKSCTSEAATASRYGMTRAALAEFRAASGNCCDICAATDNLHVDHCHATGAVRGLLCANCNSAIGKLREDPALFAAAVAYLDRHNG